MRPSAEGLILIFISDFKQTSYKVSCLSDSTYLSMRFISRGMRMR